MRQHWLLLVALYVSATRVSSLNFFTATVDPPDTPYSQLLSGNDLFETLYGTFNSTGVIVAGAILLAATGVFALPFIPGAADIKDTLQDIRNGPLGFIPKPNFDKFRGGNSGSSGGYSVPTTSTASPVVYSFDIDEYGSKRNYHVTTKPNRFTVGHIPGPPYTIKDQTKKKKKEKNQIFIHLDHPKNGGFSTTKTTSQVIEPVVNTITKAIKQTFNKYDTFDRGKTYHHPTSNRRNIITTTKATPPKDYFTADYQNDYYYYDYQEDEITTTTTPRPYLVPPRLPYQSYYLPPRQTQRPSYNSVEQNSFQPLKDYSYYRRSNKRKKRKKKKKKKKISEQDYYIDNKKYYYHRR